MVVVGSGRPLVMLPGIQGRWEWMEPAVMAVARYRQVVTGSLAGEPGSNGFEAGQGFDNYVAQLDAWLEECGISKAAVCGVSFGGLVALHYAASRPERVSALVLVSTPGASWSPDRLVRGYLKAPRMLAPLFVARAPLRMLPEIVRALPSARDAVRFSAAHLRRVARAPMSPARMSERGRLMCSLDFASIARRVSAPTLVLTGEPDLDKVVPVESTRSYLNLIALAEAAVLPGTGHIGLVSRPDDFAAIVVGFLERNSA
ncbi:MAG: alpha/beta fold hydrolase [Vicinamibacterales bacterium]